MQQDFGFIQAAHGTDWLNEQWIAMCRNEHDALLLCWNKRTVKYDQAEAARRLGIQKSHFSNILSGKKYLPNGFRLDFQRLCGNWAIRQWEDRACGFLTQRETAEQRELRLLRAKVQQLEKAA